MERSTAETIVRVYAVLAWIAGIITLIAGAALLFGGAGFLTGLVPVSGPEGAAAAGVAGGIGIVTGILLVAIGIFDIFVGIGLWRYQNWARIAAIVMSAINLLSFPIGTIIGAIGIWLFGFNEDVKSLFTGTRTLRATTTASAGKRP